MQIHFDGLRQLIKCLENNIIRTRFKWYNMRKQGTKLTYKTQNMPHLHVIDNKTDNVTSNHYWPIESMKNKKKFDDLKLWRKKKNNSILEPTNSNDQDESRSMYVRWPINRILFFSFFVNLRWIFLRFVSLYSFGWLQKSSFWLKFLLSRFATFPMFFVHLKHSGKLTQSDDFVVCCRQWNYWITLVRVILLGFRIQNL